MKKPCPPKSIDRIKAIIAEKAKFEAKLNSFVLSEDEEDDDSSTSEEADIDVKAPASSKAGTSTSSKKIKLEMPDEEIDDKSRLAPIKAAEVAKNRRVTRKNQ